MKTILRIITLASLALGIGAAHGLGMAQFLPPGWATEEGPLRVIHFAPI